MILSAAMMMASTKEATALTADDLLDKISADERVACIAGVVGGLAYSRFLRDRPDGTEMSCVYNWYYTGQKARHRQINHWFEKHLDKPVEPLLYVLIKRECGE